ncbi:abscisic acid receptor PYL2-like [Syzygium oleosum]|uniref:abscisic acid receptor PYL2-like n=1 Tax=Syzygium oleosum TaxID=219896 RepID=UPI0011D281BB|nr:abscisic acid receptor PYL2-like [Syzygium oleosum]
MKGMDLHDEISSQYALSPQDSGRLKSIIQTHHALGTAAAAPNMCTSLIARRIGAPAHAVWPLVHDFASRQRYKHFIKSCHMREGDGGVGSVRDVVVISGLPASTSVERLEVLEDERGVLSFRVIGGDHRLHDYRSVTSVNEVTTIEEERKVVTLVLESYVVQIPQGNTCEDAKLFADTIVKLNLQKLEEVVMAPLNKEKMKEDKHDGDEKC